MEPYQQPSGGDVTTLLRLWSDGDGQAFDRLIPLVYDELHRMALRYLAGERSNMSLQATGLVNECVSGCSDGIRRAGRTVVTFLACPHR
jgi:ECF sigma factor